ncbi:MAG: GIY-YIG nuclease family protein [Motiliproteus sp.]
MAEQTAVSKSSRVAAIDPSSCWYLYIIETVRGKLYTGISTDIARRFEQHKTGRGGAKFFRSDPPLRIRWSAIFSDRSSASKAEYRIKQLTRQQKLDLIRLDSKNI